MLRFRRVLAVALMLALAPLVVGAVLLQRVHTTAANPEYLKNELRRLDVYNFVEDELYPVLVAEFLQDPDGLLPSELAGVELPADPEARAAVLELLRTALPAAYVQEQVEALLDGVVPYLRGDADGFRVVPGIDERLRAVTDHEAGERSALESAFRELDGGEAVIRQLLKSAADDSEGFDLAFAPAAGVIASPAAADWFTTELFGAVDDLAPYLLGDTDAFAIQVSFASRPQLAPFFAQVLKRTPAELLREGYTLTGADLERHLRDDQASVLDDPENNLEFLQAGWALDETNFQKDSEDAAALDEFRDRVGLALGTVRRLVFAGVAFLVVLIGWLGGRGWPGRVSWSAVALALPLLLVTVLAGPVYDRVVAPALDRALLTATGNWPEFLATQRMELVEDVESIAGHLASGTVTTVLPWLVGAVVVLALSQVWARRSRDPAPPQSESEPVVDAETDQQAA